MSKWGAGVHNQQRTDKKKHNCLAKFNSIQDYLYNAFYDAIVAKQLHRKLSF